jgi:hypothetical protein
LAQQVAPHTQTRRRSLGRQPLKRADECCVRASDAKVRDNGRNRIREGFQVGKAIDRVLFGTRVRSHRTAR